MASLGDTTLLGARASTANALSIILDDSSDPVLYIGKAPTGTLTSQPFWQIIKLDETTGLVLAYADGDGNFDNVWDNRASLSYS